MVGSWEGILIEAAINPLCRRATPIEFRCSQVIRAGFHEPPRTPRAFPTRSIGTYAAAVAYSTDADDDRYRDRFCLKSRTLLMYFNSVYKKFQTLCWPLKYCFLKRCCAGFAWFSGGSEALASNAGVFRVWERDGWKRKEAKGAKLDDAGSRMQCTMAGELTMASLVTIAPRVYLQAR